MIRIVSELSVVNGSTEQHGPPVELYSGATGNVIPRKGDIVKLPHLTYELSRKVRADFNNPQFEVRKVEFSYEGDTFNPKVTVYVLEVNFFQPEIAK